MTRGPIVAAYAADAVGPAVLHFAAGAAVATGTDLVVVHQAVGTEVPEMRVPATVIRSEFTATRDLLKRRVDAVLGPGVARIELVTTSIGDDVIDRSRTAELVVIGAGSRHALMDDLFESPTAAVTRNAQCPVAVVPSGMAAPQHIICGLDRGRASAAALAWAVDEAQRRGLPLHVVQATATQKTDEQALSDWLEGGCAARRLDDLDVDIDARPGDPGRLLRALSDGQSIVVIGQRSSDAPHRIGRSATRMLLSSQAAIVVVVPEGYPVRADDTSKIGEAPVYL